MEICNEIILESNQQVQSKESSEKMMKMKNIHKIKKIFKKRALARNIFQNESKIISEDTMPLSGDIELQI